LILSGLDIYNIIHHNVNDVSKELKSQCDVEKLRIGISPFSEQNLNPNSYNLTLDTELLCYKSYKLDSRVENDVIQNKIPKSGLELIPGTLYLAKTVEFTETEGLVPIIDGRSSIGRLGVFVHVTAGYGDNGFRGCWTLELACVQPVVIYPGMKLCQIRYQTVSPGYLYDSEKYQDSKEVRPSGIWKEF